ncbi:HAD-IA family hydrolase [Marinobacterium aestuariivivens]|uniref:HAD-IA family hydrolase n=1 Tax=Marinobacterium aestuariivivens TaxID=1698799 RepID=A0ABW2A8S4_9GAMM
MYKLLIFDWDGTVIDSAARIVSSIQRAALDLAFEPPGVDAIHNIIGLGLPEAILTLYPGLADQDVGRMRERYAHYYLVADETPTALFPGARESLESLRDKGFRLAVATGKSRRGLDRVFDETGLGPLFEVSRCADETTSKPDPHMLHEILELTGLSSAEALMIGDTEYDMEMGVRAGVAGVAVSYGAHHIDRLKPYNPVLEIDHFPELEHWLDTHRQV